MDAITVSDVIAILVVVANLGVLLMVNDLKKRVTKLEGKR